MAMIGRNAASPRWASTVTSCTARSALRDVARRPRVAHERRRGSAGDAFVSWAWDEFGKSRRCSIRPTRPDIHWGGRSRWPEHYDVIIIGTGAGGGTLAHTLAPTGKKILLLERGDFLPRESENWEPDPVFVQGRYISKDTWYDADGKPFQPQVHYFVGGATKMYGAALYRLRPQDFGELKHVDGVSPAWPLTYDDFEPYYTKAEWLYEVHGNHGEDPTEGHWSKQYPWPALSHEPRIQQLSDDLAAAGYHPFHAPCGIQLDEADRNRSTCIRCTWCDGYPVPRPREVRRRGHRRATGDRPRQRDAARERRSGEARDRRRSGGSVTGVVVVARRRHGDATRPTSWSLSAGASNTRQDPARIGERPAPQRPRQRLRPGRAQLHVPQQQGGRGAVEGAERHGLPEDPRRERLLLRRTRLRLPGRPDPDGRQVERRGDEGARSRRSPSSPPTGASRRPRGTSSTSGSRPRTCRSPITASRSTATAPSTCRTR